MKSFRVERPMDDTSCEKYSVVVKKRAARTATVQQTWWDENQEEARGDWKLSQGKLGPRSDLLPKREIYDGGVIRSRVLIRLIARKNK